MYKLIGLKSMHSFICRIVLYIVLYFDTTQDQNYSTVIFSVSCDLVPLASGILTVLPARGTAWV